MLPTRSRADDALDGVVDAGVHAERQAVAGGVDGVEHAVEVVGRRSAPRAAPGRRPRAASCASAVELEDVRARRRCRARRLVERAARVTSLPRGPCARRASSSICLRLGVDHRADVGGEQCRVAERSSSIGALRASRSRGRRCRPARTARAAPSSAGRRESKAEATTSSTTCSGSAVESTIMAFRPPVSAISGTIGPSRRGQRAVDARARSRWSR